MQNDLLNNLLEALNFSPDNIPLRLQVASIMDNQGDYLRSENQYLKVLRLDPLNPSVKFKLATCYYNQEKYSASSIIIEDLLQNDSNNIELLELECHNQLNLGNFKEAKEYYLIILDIDKNYKNEDLDTEFRLSSKVEESLSQLASDNKYFLSKPDVDFSNIGGMNSVKNEIALKIIKPLEHQDLYKAYGKKIGGGILLYGPPGCGKTFIAKATAGEINANFINISINDILDMWIGQSEKNLHEVFELARKNKPCVMFIDEIDALGGNRNNVSNIQTNSINQFLLELDGINSNNEGILVVGATNMLWNIDPAFKRPGRFDRIIFVSPPDLEARRSIFKIMLQDKPKEKIDFIKLAKLSNGFSGADIKAVVDLAIENKLTESFKDGIVKPLKTKDLINAIKKVKPSTKEWFNTAKNYATYSNESGIYNDILEYLKK